MPTFVYPTAAELHLVAQDFLPRLTANRPAFEILPITTKDDDLIIWEQVGNFTGLQQIRGLNGSPPRVNAIGGNRYMMVPGAYGEFAYINEDEITRRRSFGTFADTLDLSDLVLMKQQHLLQRRYDRIEQIIWTLLTLGTFSVSSPTGGIVHTDSFPLQTFTAPVQWNAANIALATPLADMRAMQLKALGHSIVFDSTSTLYLNRVNINAILANTNQADLGGKKVMYGMSILDLSAVNTIFQGNDLPQIQPMEAGYYDETSTFQRFIATGTGVLVGKRTDGSPIGNYVMTRNANNPGVAPGAYTKVVDEGETKVPRALQVHDGHNGGPQIVFPSAVVTLAC